MSTLELVLNMLAEATTTELTNIVNPSGLEENKETARCGGTIAGNAKKEIEKETGKPVITQKNALDFPRLIAEVVEKIEDDFESSVNGKVEFGEGNYEFICKYFKSFVFFRRRRNYLALYKSITW